MNTTPTILCIAFFAMACREAQNAAPEQASPGQDLLAKYRPLLGAWVDRTLTDRSTTYERWTASGDSAFLGNGFAVSNGDTVYFEDLKLDVQNGNVVYSARVDSQNSGVWVPFTAQAAGTDSLVFENPGHDWPQCITYVKDSANAWCVTVSGVEHGAERSEVLHFSRR